MIPKEVIIKPKAGIGLQDQVETSLQNGASKLILKGIFNSQEKNLFSLLNIDCNIEIVGNGDTVLDGQNKVTHLIFIKDGVRVKIKGIKFTAGNTTNKSSQISLGNHPRTQLNIFRYLDGGAISLGMGSELILEGCVFENNNSAICGGAISNVGGYLQVINCSFYGNTCGDTGAAIDNLAAGSLTVIENSKFANNRANLLGHGNFGAVTAFPNTYLVIKNSDFSREPRTAIDYRPSENGDAHVYIDNKSKFRSEDSIVKNPNSNRGVKKAIFLRYAQLLIAHPSLVKIDGLSKVKAVDEKHKSILICILRDRNH